MTLQTPSGCFTMSIFGPLQKFSRTFAASGALRRISTRPLLSTRGYGASQTLVEAGRKSEDSCADVSGARHSRSRGDRCNLLHVSVLVVVVPVRPSVAAAHARAEAGIGGRDGLLRGSIARLGTVR